MLLGGGAIEENQRTSLKAGALRPKKKKRLLEKGKVGAPRVKANNDKTNTKRERGVKDERPRGRGYLFKLKRA